MIADLQQRVLPEHEEAAREAQAARKRLEQLTAVKE